MQSSSGKAVFGVNAAVSVALVVLVAGVALVVNPPAPPGIAAFAPQASKAITKAPASQSSATGTGLGACATGQTCVHPSPTPTASGTASRKALARPKGAVAPSAGPSTAALAGVPSSLQCFAWPDGDVTQTFDPQSPPCVPTWAGAAQGNGGATSTGVSGTEIKVAYAQDPGDTTLPQLSKLADFFNSHYELYGRKIVLVPYTSAQSKEYNTGIITPDPSDQHADAEQAASLKVFAATDFLDGTPNGVALPGYIDTLAKEHVIALTGGETAPLESVSDLSSDGDYAWSYLPTIDGVMASAGGLVCRQLVGHDAVNSGSYKTKVRTWALLLPDQAATGGTLPGLSGLMSTLASCGISNPKVVYFDPNDKTGGNLSASLTQFKAQGITSLLTIPWYGAGSPGGPQHVADTVGYHPEWVSMAFQAWITGAAVEVPTQQLTHTFGVAAWNKLQPLGSEPWYEAYSQAGGDTSTAFEGASGLYKELQILASGIQAAGPDLTPQTFGAALHSTVFPNPGASSAPSYQAHVGFAQNNEMVNNFAGFWMNPAAGSSDFFGDESSFNDYQMFCYASLGERSTAATWPTTSTFYQGCT